MKIWEKTEMPPAANWTWTQVSCDKKINGILLPKLFWPTVRKKCSTDREKLLKSKAEGREFAKFLKLLGQFIQTVNGQFLVTECVFF